MSAPDDQQRLDALKRFFVLDHSDTEDELARLVRVAAGLYGVAYGVLTLREADSERIAVAYGFDAATLPEDAVFCERPVGPSLPLAVADVSEDARFAKNPLVHGPQQARFYAGVPLKSADGFTLGTLALLDSATQELNGEGLAMLVDLGALVEPALNLQRARTVQAEAERRQADAEQKQAEAEQAVAAMEQAYRTAGQAFQAMQQDLDAARQAREAAEQALAETHQALEDAQQRAAALEAERDAACDTAADAETERERAAETRLALTARLKTLTTENATLAAARDEATAARNAAVAERDAARDASRADDAEHEALQRALARKEALAAAAAAAAEALVADPTRLDEALGSVTVPTGATRAALVVKAPSGPTVRAAWHADGATPLAEPDEVLDADALDTWAEARGVSRLTSLPLPGALVLLDAPTWNAHDEPAVQAAFALLALNLRRLAAEDDERTKSQLLASMSHEVRSALTSILGYAEVLADEVGPGGSQAANTEAREMVGTILTSSTRLLHTLNAIMDVARLEATETPALQPVDVGAAVEAAVSPFRAQAEARDLAFLTEGTDAGAYAWADAGALGRVLDHLLTNAFTYTDQGGVRLRVHADAGAVSVEVQDTGVGIDVEFLPHLFDEFRHEDGERGRNGRNSGLGLSITKRLVDLMGGQITVTSLKGQGSVFRIALRAVLADASSDVPTPSAAFAVLPSGDVVQAPLAV